MLAKFGKYMRNHLRHQEIVVLALAISGAACCYPLQHVIAISRVQHYSIGLFIVATGFAIQAGLSWRPIGKWGRIAMVSSCLALTVLSGYFWTNAWVPDLGLATQTQRQEMRLFLFGMATVLVFVSFSWLKWGIDTSSSEGSDK